MPWTVVKNSQVQIMFQVLAERFKSTENTVEAVDRSTSPQTDLSDRLFEKFQRYKSGLGLAGANVLIISKTPDALEALAAGQGATIVWAPDLRNTNVRLSIDEARPHFVLLQMDQSADIVKQTETYNAFRKTHPNVVIILCSEKFMWDETGPSRPAFCDAVVALPTTPEKLHATAHAAQKNRARNLHR